MRPLIIFSLLVFTGCDNSETSEGVRHAYVDRHSDGFVYEGTTHEHVLGAVKGVFEERGFEVEPGAEPLTWKTKPVHGGHGWDAEEYSIHMTDLRWRKGFLLSVVRKLSNKDGQATSSREDTLEWEIIQRADPDRAADIMAKANDRADKVPPRVHHDN